MDIAVHHAEQLPTGLIRLITEVTFDDGTTKRGFHFMPQDTVEWRVAQFNITPEQALDLAITEPFLREDQSVTHDLQPRRSLARNMALEAADSTATVTYLDGPIPDEMQASPDAVSESGEGDPKAFLLDILPVEDAVIEQKRAVMDVNRAVVQEAGGVEPSQPFSRRLPPPIPQDNSHFVTDITESPSELAQRMIESRLEQVRTRRNAPES